MSQPIQITIYLEEGPFEKDSVEARLYDGGLVRAVAPVDADDAVVADVGHGIEDLQHRVTRATRRRIVGDHACTSHHTEKAKQVSGSANAG